MGGFIQSRQNETIRNRTYFGPEHLAPGPALVITSVWYERRGKKGNVSVLYKLLGEGIYRSPRELTVWFDNKESEFITKELENWKDLKTKALQDELNKFIDEVTDKRW